ncbi:hypothetical protein [Leptospira sp. GIMC2001]|uniref:hypothetical protein n=1 Tax=Leptospira sp. GIMC2001 TaxID=1513297 RepID=UPI0023494A16|nr:hypothetical protein [Leptospira sp. GIMC2001]WCL47562.1 hypothetical protein O4O04_00935 [Leptospira sp. GIMC2001]
MKKRIILLLIIFIASLKILDWVFIEKLYFTIPNEMEWDTSPWYNFLDHRKKINFSETEKGVLLAGSSIALYSTLPEEINEGQTDFKAEYYSHVAMAPTDFYYYLDDVIAKKPKYVVYIFNPADFQLEYLKESEKGDSTEFQYQEWLNYFSWRIPARLFYPNDFVADYWLDLNKNQIYRLMSKGFLAINRYREFFWDPVLTYFERHFRSGRSYHLYTGSMPKEGIWSHGWTPTQFSVSCEVKQLKWKDSIYIPQENLDIVITYDDQTRTELKYKKAGWYPIEIYFPESTVIDNRSNLHFTVSKPFSSKIAENKPYGKEYDYGIRLSQNFCSNELKTDFSYKRPLFLDETRFRSMSIQEYRQDYFERIYKDKESRPELLRMKVLAEQKEMIRDLEFKPWLEIDRFRQIQERLEREGIIFLLVSSPENPPELKRYKDRKWYLGMLDYLGTESGGHLFDLSNVFSDERYFSDPHHLTYEGAQKFSSILREILLKEIQEGESNE